MLGSDDILDMTCKGKTDKHVAICYAYDTLDRLHIILSLYKDVYFISMKNTAARESERKNLNDEIMRVYFMIMCMCRNTMYIK